MTADVSTVHCKTLAAVQVRTLLAIPQELHIYNGCKLGKNTV